MVHANNLAFPRLSPHIPSMLAPFLFSPPLLFLSAQHDSIFRKKKPPPPDEYRILIEKCQELCSEKHKLNTRLFTRCMIDCDDAEDITNKLHSPYALLLTPAQREKRIFTECTDVVPAKHPPKIKSELFSLL